MFWRSKYGTGGKRYVINDELDMAYKNCIKIKKDQEQYQG